VVVVGNRGNETVPDNVAVVLGADAATGQRDDALEEAEVGREVVAGSDQSPDWW
jgi:hypothetical protein